MWVVLFVFVKVMRKDKEARDSESNEDASGDDDEEDDNSAEITKVSVIFFFLVLYLIKFSNVSGLFSRLLS